MRFERWVLETTERQEECEGHEMVPLVLTFVFSGEHVVKGESHWVDLARELEAPLLALAAQGLQCHQQVTASVCGEKAGRKASFACPHQAQHRFEPSTTVCCWPPLISWRAVPAKPACIYLTPRRLPCGSSVPHNEATEGESDPITYWIPPCEAQKTGRGKTVLKNTY